VRQLLALSPDASEADRVAVLQEYIETFNDIDSKFRFISTIEREDVC
jgi:hypothetical protein